MNANKESMNTAKWQALDHAHHLHPFTNHKALHERGTQVITRADGIYLWDSDGNQILDGMAGLWCVNIGYGREELADVAAQQMRDLPYYNTFFQSAHPPVIELSKCLAEITPPGLDHFFYVNSGSEANDTVVRMVRHYWATRGEPLRTVIISRQNAYHGSTMASGSLGGMIAIHSQGMMPIPDIVHINQPYWFGEANGQDPEQFGRDCARQLVKRILDIGPERIGAFIGEPIQGAGGVIIPPQSYWPEIQQICRDYGILLVADEVICGFGRTGQWFGSDTFDIQPDLMPMAKGLSSGYLPIGAVAVRDQVAETLIESGREFTHGFTYSGHPVSAAVALRNVEIMRREKIVEEVRDRTAPYFHEQWSKIVDHPLIGEARSIGLLGALEIVKPGSERERFDPETQVGIKCREAALDNGLIMRAVGNTMVVSPPLIISPPQIDEMIARIWRSLDQTLEAVS